MMATKTKVHGIIDGLANLAVPIERLEAAPVNARQGDVAAISVSYERFGQRKPIVARRTGGTPRAPTGVVTAGNHQLKAATLLGWTHIAVVWVDDDDRTANAYAIADNRTSDLAVNDDETLAQLLTELAAEADGLLEASGYATSDLDDLLAEIAEASGSEGGTGGGDILSLIDVSVGDPNHSPERGDVFTLTVPSGVAHVLVIANVMKEWPLFVEYLVGDALLMPFPDPYITHTDLAERQTMVLVQNDLYLAGHLLDKHAAVFGADTITRLG